MAVAAARSPRCRSPPPLPLDTEEWASSNPAVRIELAELLVRKAAGEDLGLVLDDALVIHGVQRKSPCAAGIAEWVGTHRLCRINGREVVSREHLRKMVAPLSELTLAVERAIVVRGPWNPHGLPGAIQLPVSAVRTFGQLRRVVEVRTAVPAKLVRLLPVPQRLVDGIAPGDAVTLGPCTIQDRGRATAARAAAAALGPAAAHVSVAGALATDDVEPPPEWLRAGQCVTVFAVNSGMALVGAGGRCARVSCDDLHVSTASCIVTGFHGQDAGQELRGSLCKLLGCGADEVLCFQDVLAGAVIVALRHAVDRSRLVSLGKTGVKMPDGSTVRVSLPPQVAAAAALTDESPLAAAMQWCNGGTEFQVAICATPQQFLDESLRSAKGPDCDREKWASTAAGAPWDREGWRLAEDPVIGKGSYGRVLRCFAPARAGGSAECAVKEVRKDGASTHSFRQVRQLLVEVSTTLCVDHPGIVKTLQVVHDSAALYFVMPLVKSGDLWRVMRAAVSGRLQPAAVATVLHQLLSAIKYLHSLKIVHRDVKPENVLVTPGTWRAQLCDFGLAKFLGGDAQGQLVAGHPTRAVLDGTERVGTPPFPFQQVATPGMGTTVYGGPEFQRYALGESAPPGMRLLKHDVYGAGITAFCALAGRTPFVVDVPAIEDAHRRRAAYREALIVRMRRGIEWPDSLAELHPHCRELVGCLMAEDADERPHAAAALESAWLRSTQAAADDHDSEPPLPERCETEEWPAGACAAVLQPDVEDDGAVDATPQILDVLLDVVHSADAPPGTAERSECAVSEVD
eukprot:TRINITY_DN39402_c0_g1_i1.p1 TRINITY_DN39402_c0_g1~~TRINITY_DN39402_c0_g1_i1.p1  ORF type:complete len:799 (+),score=240.99 TRINITY_DN39402_c0_g1_i1:81-2477(+)